MAATALNDEGALLYGARYIYFVPRKALDSLDEPHTFTIGNIGDLLLAYKNNWNKKNGIELGYTARFRFGAHISPNLDDIVKKTNYIRSNFYIVYKYRFIWNDTFNEYSIIFHMALITNQDSMAINISLRFGSLGISAFRFAIAKVISFFAQCSLKLHRG